MDDSVQLRPVAPEDLPLFFVHHLELPAVGDASAAEGDRRAAFLGRWERLLADGTVLARTVLWRGEVAGYVAHFVQLEKPAIAYWLGRDMWGRGIASSAVGLFLPLVEARPLYARVACDNPASLRVLEKNRFEVVDQGRFF